MTAFAFKKPIEDLPAQPREDGKIVGTKLDGRRRDALGKKRANKNAKRIGEVDESTVAAHYDRKEPLSSFWEPEWYAHAEKYIRRYEALYLEKGDEDRRFCARFDLLRLLRWERAQAREDRRKSGFAPKLTSRKKAA